MGLIMKNGIQYPGNVSSGGGSALPQDMSYCYCSFPRTDYSATVTGKFNTPIIFEENLLNNLTCEDGKIFLTKGKSYLISYSAQATLNGGQYLSIQNSDNSVLNQNETNYSYSPVSGSIIYKSEKDSDYVYLSCSGGTGTDNGILRKHNLTFFVVELTEGFTSNGEGSYTLPIASAETLGGIKIGENLSITEDGTLNAEASGTSVLSPGAILYDTKEKIVGKWINGKPLYQKVGEIDTSIIDKIVYQSKDPYVSIVPPMNQDETDEIKLTAAGVTTGNSAYRAFDKSYTGNDVCWYHNTLPTWIQVQFKIEPKKINKIRIGQEIASPQFFKTYIIQGSNDGTTYTDIATFVENYHSAGQIYEHTFDNENSYSYYRIYFSDNSGGGGVSVEEIELFEIDYTDVITYYTKKSDTENSFNIGMVENINLEQNIDFSNIYSLDERIVGCWVNGKPIYQKTWTINMGSSDWQKVQDITNEDFQTIEEILKAEIYDTDSTTPRRAYCCTKKMNNTMIRFMIIIEMSSIDHYTLMYTKTTDEENSFNKSMIGNNLIVGEVEFEDLYVNTSGSREDTITVENLFDYDYIILQGGNYNSVDQRTYYYSNVCDVSLLNNNSMIGIFNDSQYLWYKLNDNILTYHGKTASQTIMIYKIIGIKKISAKSENISINKHTYSTKEQVVGTWIDGKNIYEMTINQNNNNSIDVSSLNIDTLIKLTGIGTNPNKQTYTIPYQASTSYEHAIYYDEPSKTIVTVKSPTTNITSFITIQYTKTTD